MGVVLAVLLVAIGVCHRALTLNSYNILIYVAFFYFITEDTWISYLISYSAPVVIGGLKQGLFVLKYYTVCTNVQYNILNIE